MAKKPEYKTMGYIGLDKPKGLPLCNQKVKMNQEIKLNQNINVKNLLRQIALYLIC